MMITIISISDKYNRHWKRLFMTKLLIIQRISKEIYNKSTNHEIFRTFDVQCG